VFEPQLVLMDEPLGALDKQLREHMQMEIKHIHERLGVTVVYVTHDQGEALTMSDRVAVFHQGEIQQIAPPRDLYDAWVMSIITPLVEIARDDVKIFEDRYKKDIRLHKVPLLAGISDEQLPEVFDWSRSNLCEMYEIGYRQGKAWAKSHRQ
jgi:ABC-type Fe3+/spermidine/putrescine transport system ATPase subunit